MTRRFSPPHSALRSRHRRQLRSRSLLFESLEERTVLSGVYGWAWNDADLDGVWDTGESALSGRTVFLDTDKDGQRDAGEVSTTTDSNGYYVFGGLSPGLYTVAQVLPSGWRRTWPTDAAHTVTISTANLWVEADFGYYESPDFTLSKTTATVSEPNGTDTFTAVLTAQPLTNVVFSVGSSDTTEVTAAPATLTFTPGNWNVAQTVTLTAADDVTVDGAQVSTMTVSVVDASSDSAWDPLADKTVTVTTNDNDVAGFTLGPTSGLTTTESGGTAAFTIVLNTLPAGNVTIPISSSDTTEGDVSPASLTFTTATGIHRSR